MTEPIDRGDGLGALEAWLANEWAQADEPLDVDETVTVLRSLADCCYVLASLDVDTVYAAARQVQLGRYAGALSVLAGLAHTLAEED
jgi:hypothetical protein